uniref:Uncharacterized protein n=1 Tax=Oryza barthii TaxID=65489 RepID=A0A0D3F5M3_9ORYZ
MLKAHPCRSPGTPASSPVAAAPTVQRKEAGGRRSAALGRAWRSDGIGSDRRRAKARGSHPATPVSSWPRPEGRSSPDLLCFHRLIDHILHGWNPGDGYIN